MTESPDGRAPTPRRKSRPHAQTAVRRNEILEAAVEVFGRKGYSNSTLAEIAQQVNMTHAGILHHFGSKHQLLLDVLQFRDDTDVQNLPGQRVPDGIEFFRHLVTTALSNAHRAGLVQTFVVLSAESVTEGHPARDYFVSRYQTLRAEALQAFEMICAERGVVPPAQASLAAAAILAVMDGLQVQWLLDPTNVDLVAATEFAIDAILASVLEPRASILERA
ncbi:TetR/AcrR family transcriptional regulator [Subtercola vilae]|uniref:TetR/AcrR family transcriptional regulator n=1 Tax=Subtercola vilae TaxID=2056433 RepID=A0A4T2C934_9MICO|nr:TetR/AcrR family transcriptional regulator [Subtercola vilae]TIH40975.1 TetR/AcrR family transcriptional regulator [Subtercola vilae]